MRKEVKQCIKYYLENINSDEYKSYKLKNDTQNKEAQRESREEVSDYYEDAIVTEVAIGDVLSNDGVTKLLKKIYTLSHKKFKITTDYRKPSIIKKYDYIHFQYLHSAYRQFAEIDLLEDCYIKKIVISWAQINSYYAFLEYHFILKEWLDDELYNQFIYNNIQKINSNDYVIWHHIDDNKKMNYWMMEQMKDEYFTLIFQHYITSYLYSEQGKTSQLPNMVYMTRKKPIDINTIYLCGMEMAYYNRKANFIISSDFEKANYTLYDGKNYSSRFSLYEYIAQYGNEFYNRFFGASELNLFEREFSKFITGRRKITYNKELKYLFSKMQSVSEIENKKIDDFYEKYNDGWDFYIFGNKKDLEEFHKNSTAKIQEIYKDNFEYLKLLSEMNYAKSNHINAFVATFVSIMAVIIALISLLTSFTFD